MATKVDLLLVNPPGKQRIYQSLATDLAAHEPPVWAVLLASAVRRRGYCVVILDADAQQMSFRETAEAARDFGATLTVLVVYGQQPSASTQSMPAASEVCRLLKDLAPERLVMFVGGHPSALPEQTLREEACDFVCQGEGPGTILATLAALATAAPALEAVPGLWHQTDGVLHGKPPAANISRLDEEFGPLAWDLLPMDRYRAHNWHCWGGLSSREPYASFYTSLGCPYHCSFCCINAPFGGSGIRYFTPAFVLREIETLVESYGVRNIKIADEMFVLNPGHVLEIADGIVDRGYDVNVWAYARVDTIKERYLERLKKAGFHWLALGIESGSRFVRDGMQKGRFSDEDIASVVGRIRASGINVCGNYIFGLPDDTLDTMQDTLDLAVGLNTEYANFYCAMAYPGSPLHERAVADGQFLPESSGGPGWIGYSQYAFEALPLATETVPAGKVLSFRDHAFNAYFQSPGYLAMMRGRFGDGVVDHLQFMTSHNLERKYALPLDGEADAPAKGQS